MQTIACLLIAEVQVCKCSSHEKHSVLANCLLLTRWGLAVVNFLWFFYSCFHSPSLVLPCLVSLQPSPWACPYFLPACWVAFLLATTPCYKALLHSGEDKRLSSAAFPVTPSGQWEGLLQKEALTRKSCPCQSVPIREPGLSSALRHSSPNTNNTWQSHQPPRGTPALQLGPRPRSVICVLQCDTWEASCLQKVWQIFNNVRTFQ